MASKDRKAEIGSEFEPLCEIDDKTLLERFYRDADDDALAAFVGRHRAWAVAKAREYYAEEAEDVVQTSILRLMDSTPTNGEVANPLGWWSVIISTAAMDALRRTMRRRRREQESLRLGGPAEEPDVAESVGRMRILDAVFAEIEALEDQFRGPLLKRYFEDLSYREIAEALDCRPGTVASRLSRGIARLRDGLARKGILELSSEALGGGGTMPDVSRGNREFAARWRDVWIVHHSERACGLGHISARLGSDGTVNVRKRMDIPLESSLDGPPESAETRLWFEGDLVLTDAENFRWRSFRSAEGATPTAAAMMAEWGMRYDEDVLFRPTNAGGLSIKAKRGKPTLAVKGKGDGPIVPDALMELYACARPRDREKDWPVRILGFHRDLAGRHWRVTPLFGRYVGRKGPPTGLSHAYEVRLPDSIARSFSIWASDDGRFIGFGDEQESYVAAEDEATARAFIAARRSQ